MNPIDPLEESFQSARISHWNSVAQKMRHWTSLGKYYHSLLAKIYSRMIPPGSKVLAIGCGNGDLLSSLKPSIGVGVDISPEMIALARDKHPELDFINDREDRFSCESKFDFIVFSDVLNDVWDVQSIFEHIQPLITTKTRIIINSYNRLWEIPLAISEKLGLSRPRLGQNWLTVSDLKNLLELSGFESIRTSRDILFPVSIPVLSPVLNCFLVRFWPFNQLALTNFIIARPDDTHKHDGKTPVVSIIVPARNEAGNVENIINRIPELGAGTEIVFVEGNSTDDTYKVIEEAIPHHPDRNIVLLRQDGKGKGDAVRKGFAAARGDVLMILDADLTVPPEDLPRFYDALVSNKGDFINGVRLIYPMEDQAMRFFNLIGNKLFSLAFSWILGQPIKDTLCGTKVLWKDDYSRIAANHSKFGDFDPFGDFDLIFGASALNYKLVDLPIRYRARTYGDTNIQRWKHGWLLLKMVVFAARKIKFQY